MTLENVLKRFEAEKQQTIDWDARKNEWINRVNELYQTIEGWFAHLAEQHLITFRRTRKRVDEEFLGEYEIDDLEIDLADRTVIFEPIARNVIGALGRIDLYLRGYKSDGLLLVLQQDVEGNLRWEIWKSKLSGYRMPFDQVTFEHLLENWLFT